MFSRVHADTVNEEEEQSIRKGELERKFCLGHTEIMMKHANGSVSWKYGIG